MSNVKIQMLQEQTKRIVPLFDSSDGRGISPEKWPTPEGWSKEYGYAGGIGPDNVWQALYEIQKAIAQYVRDGYVPFWIDMETKVRSDDKFSLVKVNYVLAACQRWREQEG
jgi:hypothetical protein